MTIRANSTEGVVRDFQEIPKYCTELWKEMSESDGEKKPAARMGLFDEDSTDEEEFSWSKGEGTGGGEECSVAVGSTDEEELSLSKGEVTGGGEEWSVAVGEFSASEEESCADAGVPTVGEGVTVEVAKGGSAKKIELELSADLGSPTVAEGVSADAGKGGSSRKWEVDEDGFFLDDEWWEEVAVVADFAKFFGSFITSNIFEFVYGISNSNWCDE